MSGDAEARGLRAFVLEFYAARRNGDIAAIRRMIDPAVRWQEPAVGTHMGLLEGVDAVIDMMSRAQGAVDGTFRLEVGTSVETGTSCAFVVRWTADKNGRALRGEELVVFTITDARIVEAIFFASDISQDEEFWK